MTYVPTPAIDAAQSAHPHLSSDVHSFGEREVIRTILESAAALIQADALHLAASQMNDPEDAEWLTAWANDLEES